MAGVRAKEVGSVTNKTKMDMEADSFTDILLYAF